MLGLLHEHQSPMIDCGFKSDEAIAKLIGWSLHDVKTNFDQIKASPNIDATNPDLKSIMMYQLPDSYYTAGKSSPCYILAANQVLSPADIKFLKSFYPKK
jgi:hypothetical protein